jgi:hypothetical protein
VGDGRHTSFWNDNWHCLGVLSFRFEALFSHWVRQNASVSVVVDEGLALRPPLKNCKRLVSFSLVFRLVAMRMCELWLGGRDAWSTPRHASPRARRFQPRGCLVQCLSTFGACSLPSRWLRLLGMPRSLLFCGTFGKLEIM